MRSWNSKQIENLYLKKIFCKNLRLNKKKINKMSKQKTLLKNFEKFQAVKGNIPI